MLYVESNGTIRLTRGDTARLIVTIENETLSENYEIAEDDTLTFSVKKSAKDAEPLLQKSIVGSNVFYIRPEDTSELSFRKYKYDVQLKTAEGDVYTIIVPTTFELLQEVTW